MPQSAAPPRLKPPVPAIKFGSVERGAGETRYGRMLVAFMRVLSLLWLLQGLMHWLPVLAPADPALDTMSSAGVSAVIFFSVIDLIAAVGLWLATPWGGVVWLVAVAAQWCVCFLLPRFFDFDIASAVLGAVLVAIYFFLTYEAARENAPYV